MYIICTQRYTEFGESKMAANSKITVNKKIIVPIFMYISYKCQ